MIRAKRVRDRDYETDDGFGVLYNIGRKNKANCLCISLITSTLLLFTLVGFLFGVWFSTIHNASTQSIPMYQPMRVPMRVPVQHNNNMNNMNNMNDPNYMNSLTVNHYDKAQVLAERDAACTGECCPSAPEYFDATGQLSSAEASAFFTIDICQGLFAYGNGYYFGMFFISDDDVVFIDAPGMMAQAIPYIVATKTDKPITKIIYSHHHLDHIAGADQIPNINTAEIICHELTQENILQVNRVPDEHVHVPECTTTIRPTPQRPYRLFYGQRGKEVIISHAGYRWHTDNDLFILFPEQRTVMAIDLVFPGWVPFKNLAMASHVYNYRRAHEFVLSLDAEWMNYIGGHVDRIGNRADVKLNAIYYDELIGASRAAIHNVSLGVYFHALYQNKPELAGDPDKKWTNFKGYLDAQAQECARIMNGLGWDGIYKDFNSFNEEHCWWTNENHHIMIA